MSTKPTRRTQEERSTESSEAMINACIELIPEHSSMVSMKQIGERSGYSHGLVLQRFGSKEGLLLEVTRKVHQQFTSSVSDLVRPSDNAYNHLCEVVEAFYAAIKDPTPAGVAFTVLMGESVRDGSVIRSIFKRSDAIFRRYIGSLIQKGIDEGSLREEINVIEVAGIIVAALRGVSMQLMINPNAFDVDKAQDEMLSLIGSLAKTEKRRKRVR